MPSHQAWPDSNIERRAMRMRREFASGPAPCYSQEGRSRASAREAALAEPGAKEPNYMRRVILIVLDSVGVGELPDAEEYGDRGSNTIGNLSRAVGGVHLPNLGRLGLGNLTDIKGVPPVVASMGAYGKLAEASKGKDTTTGHWEIAGIYSPVAFPTYPHGFPPDVIRENTSDSSAGKPWATIPRQARSFSMSWARSTCAPATLSSTLRRTACSKSPRTRTSSLSGSCIVLARSRARCWGATAPWRE